MGTVYRAENELTGKQVAIKWMHPHLAANPDAAERMLREARASSKLSHPNVVDVYDVVRDNETLFLVMELLQGETLREYLRHQQHPKLSEFITLMLGAMAGVAAAHQHGVIHRDLKPDNIFLERIPGIAHPTAKVVDFGIAKLAEIRGSTLTETGAAIGTPVYMSLEQLRGDRDIDGRTDVYAFGVMLYEAVVGRMPYDAATLPELAIKVATTDASGVRSVRPDVPAALADVIDRAIARDRTQRWPDIHTLMHQLTPFANESGLRGQSSQPIAHSHGAATGWPAAPRNTYGAQRTWDATQALNSHTSPALATRQGRNETVRTDSLTGRELSHTRTPLSQSRPVWIAAASFFSVSALAAYLLLGDGDKPERTETSIHGVETPPKQVTVGPIRPAPPTVPDLEIPVDPTQPQAPLPSAPAPTAQPVEPETPETPPTHRPQDRPRRLGRPRVPPDKSLPSLPPERPEPEPAPASKPKNAADVLGF